MTQRLLYDKDGAAEQLSTSPRTIDDLRRGRKLIAVWQGGKWKYPHDELKRYVDHLQTNAELER